MGAKFKSISSRNGFQAGERGLQDFYKMVVLVREQGNTIEIRQVKAKSRRDSWPTGKGSKVNPQTLSAFTFHMEEMQQREQRPGLYAEYQLG